MLLLLVIPLSVEVEVEVEAESALVAGPGGVDGRPPVAKVKVDCRLPGSRSCCCNS